MAAFAALLAVVLAWGLVSGRLARYSVTLPIVLVVVGAVLSAIHVVVVQLDSESVRILVELALSVLLFADATEISARWLRSAGRLPLRMLALGFPVTIAAGFAAGYLLFPGLSLWVVALLAAALAATDAALASPVIMDERLPRRLRRIIDVESGLNDGLATPLVLFFLAGAVASGGPVGGEAPLVHALVELAVGVVAGVVLGAVGATAAGVRAAGELEQRGRGTAGRPGPAGAHLPGRDDPGRQRVRRRVRGGHRRRHRGSGGGQRRAAAADQRRGHAGVRGRVVRLRVAHPERRRRGITWNVLLYAVLSLTLIRMVPVALALLRSGLGTREVLFLGWIGPRGLASILFGLIAIEELHAHGLTAAADFVAEVIVVTVGLSVLLHGLTAGVIAARWPADRTNV